MKPKPRPPSAADYLPERASLKALRDAAAGCQGCHLHERGTQTVFGEGLRRARVMLVGEQPGDQEDRKGRPFVGPAGRLLDRGLVRAGIDRDEAYVTNVVKHFKWVPRGKRRLHSKPNSAEIQACLPWLEAEIEVVQPVALVCLGATAAQAILGPKFRVSRQRGTFFESPLSPRTLATVHPSSVLRAPTDEDRRAGMEAFIADLARVAELLEGREDYSAAPRGEAAATRSGRASPSRARK